MPEISEIFGSESLSYDEFKKRISERGLEFGDVAEVRRGYEDRITEIRCMSALEREMEKAGVRNTSLMTKLIDMGAITADEGGVHGIAEQIDALRESDPYLFVAEKKNTLKSVMTGERHGMARVDPDKMSDADFYKQVKLI